MPRSEETEGYLDRLRTVLYKANVLRLYGADMYIVVRRRNKITEYSSSSTDAHWPPSRTQIVSLASQYNHTSGSPLSGSGVSLPGRKSPADFEERLKKSKQQIKGICRSWMATRSNLDEQNLVNADLQQQK